ncbi:GGDEF domain-containing protein [Psychromonas sp. MME1]
MRNIMAIANSFKSPTSDVSFAMNGKVIYGKQPVISEHFINKNDAFSLLRDPERVHFQLDLNIAEPTEEITHTINHVLSPILTTGAILLIILLIISLFVANILANSFNQLNTLIKTFKFNGDILSKGFLISEFNDVSKLLHELSTTITQQVNSLKSKNNELAKVDQQREKYLVEVRELNSQLEEKVGSRTIELKETLDTLAHSHFILEELTHFRRTLETRKSNRAIANIFIDSINKCQDNSSIALYLPEQYQHKSTFIEDNMAYIIPSAINDIVLTLGKSPTSIHCIMFENHQHHLCTFNVGNNLLGWVILKESNNSQENSNWIKLFIAELQSYLMMRHLNENLAYLASTDSLTGLKNRKSFDQFLTNLELQKNATCVLYVIDVNGLKTINDEQGHEQGDALIQRMGKVLYESTEGITEHVFRVGGDEFAIILNENECIAQQKLTEILIKQKSTNSGEYNVSFSFGCASSDECSIALLYSVADKRMYLDKKSYYRNNRDRRK